MKSRSPDAEVVAFEPAPGSADLIRRNIELHALRGVRVREVALGREPQANAPFAFYPMAPSNSTRYPHEKELQKVVLARTMPAYSWRRPAANGSSSSRMRPAHSRV